MKDIIISAKNGDPEAFGRLYESCRKAGLSIAKQFVKNDTDAEDMYQDAFLKAMENIDRFDENREFVPWLNTIIANTCKDFLGKKRPMNFTDMSDEETEFVDTIESTDVSTLPESVYVRKEMLQIVDGIVEMLPNEQKEATLLFYFKDFSVKQVAEYQNVSEDTVKSRLNYSRKKVEQATRDYEKKHGIKICIASVIPAILVLYFKNNAYAAQMEAALSALSASNALTEAGLVAKAGTGALKTGTAAGKVAAGKIAAIVGAGIIAATGAGFAIHHFVTSGDREKTVAINSKNRSEESEVQTESAIQDKKSFKGYINDEGYYVFGTYEQDGDESNGPEPIEWEILDENENGTLLISRYVLDSVRYNETREEVTWENCSLRSWLNNDFYNTAFDDEMKASINTVTIDNEDNPLWGTSGGNNTSDKIFCLSLSEIIKYYSHYNSWPDVTLDIGYNQALMTPATKYAENRGAPTKTMTSDLYEGEYEEYSTDCIGKNGAGWWLRTPGKDSDANCAVHYFGRVGANCIGGVSNPHGVRPALYISEEIDFQEEKSSEGYINDEGYYVFGTYEQDDDGFNGPEPIEWEILDENENGILLISRYVLYGIQYNDTREGTTWETCSLREWLNNDFYNAAFDDEQKKYISTVTLVNGDNQICGTSGGNDTNDKIFCLSLSEVLKYYDFNSWYTESNPCLIHNGRPEYNFGFSEDLIIEATKYTRGVGNFAYNEDSNFGYQGFPLSNPGYSDSCIGKLGANWWLRTPGETNREALTVSPNGLAGEKKEASIYAVDIGVRPALYIQADVQEAETQEDVGVQEAETQEEPQEETATEELSLSEEKTPNGYINYEGYYVFGAYEQDGDESNGPEPIEWEILDENENGTLLISRYVLDYVRYDKGRTYVTWENCSLRSWLNSDFYNTAFDDEMKSQINTVTLVNSEFGLPGHDDSFDEPGGRNTSDNIFCLNLTEILKYYSFNSWNSDQLCGYSQALITPATKYATDKGVDAFTISDAVYQNTLSSKNYSADCIGKTGASWWLRRGYGFVDYYGGRNLYISQMGYLGIRPALYINK